MKVTNLGETHFYPRDHVEGLQELILFPGDRKKNGIPNGSVWIYDSTNHEYVPEILGEDTGCGMSAGMLLGAGNVDIPALADRYASYVLKEKPIGRGNHFIDICGPVNDTIISGGRPVHKDWYDLNSDYKIILVHTDAKNAGVAPPSTIEDAIIAANNASAHRLNILRDLSKVSDHQLQILGDWPHNTIEQTEGKMIYRKGAVKAKGRDLLIFPFSLGKPVLYYSVPEGFREYESSVPHGSGRRGPTSENKVSVEKARELRQQIYVPALITDESLCSEHPDNYNSENDVIDLIPLAVIRGESDILAYIGKI